MKIGIIGPGGSGKTTLFNALTGRSAQTGGAARKTHIGVVKVPDERLLRLQKLTGRKNRVHAEIAFSDVAGEFAKPDREKGLDPELANMMKPLDAFAVVLGEFPEFEAAHGGKSSPGAQAAEIESDLVINDLIAVENKLDRMKRELVPDNFRLAIEKCKESLDAERPLRVVEFNPSEERLLAGFSFLSLKPLLFVRNVAEGAVSSAPPADLRRLVETNGAKLLTVCAKVEAEIAEMDEGDRAEFLKAMGITESALDGFVRASYEACSLISFFTTGAGGPDESRAWTIRRGSTALEAAGKIHSDIQRGFIRAEVIHYDDFSETGGYEGAKARGKMKLEGKEYVVMDGDIINFRFNV